MALNKGKLAVGTALVGVTATGWGLYGAEANKPPVLTQEEVSEPQPAIELPNLKELVKEQQKFVWEINVRDGMIDNKNGQIEELNNELNRKQKRNDIITKEFLKEFNDNLRLKKRIQELEKENKAWEEYAEDLEWELDNKDSK